MLDYEYGEKVDIEFSFSRSPLKLSHRALDQVQARNMASMMFPTSFDQAKKKKSLKKYVYHDGKLKKKTRPHWKLHYVRF